MVTSCIAPSSSSTPVITWTSIASYYVSGWALLPASNYMNWNTKGKHDASETQTEVATTLPDMRMFRIGNCLPIVQVAAHFLLL
jgi:hypothetical protein